MAKIYPISPPRIVLEEFIPKLKAVLVKHQPDYFQLRLKNIPDAEIISAAKMLIPVCHDYRVKFIINDSAEIALAVNADGVHIGVDDGNVAETRRLIGDKILGVSCYNSVEAAVAAVNDGADIVSFGAFYPTTTKQARSRAEVATLEKFKKQMLGVATCAIGGINFENRAPLDAAGVDYICMISALWG